MRFLKQKTTEQRRLLHLARIKKQMQGIQNEMEFVEILAQFWPLPNMAEKMERLERRLHFLSDQYHQDSKLRAV